MAAPSPGAREKGDRSAKPHGNDTGLRHRINGQNDIVQTPTFAVDLLQAEGGKAATEQCDEIDAIHRVYH